jgi:hypothetical protein
VYRRLSIALEAEALAQTGSATKALETARSIRDTHRRDSALAAVAEVLARAEHTKRMLGPEQPRNGFEALFNI